MSTTTTARQIKVGDRVTLTTRQRRCAANFAGWEHSKEPGFAEANLLPIPADLVGVVVCIEHHGSNPWTRFGVRFPDGSSAHGVVPADITVR